MNPSRLEPRPPVTPSGPRWIFRPIRMLVLVMAVLGIIFAGGVAGLEYLALKSGSEADSMLDNALPSTERLTEIARALGHLDTELDRAMSRMAPGGSPDWYEVRLARNQIQIAFDDYRRMDAYPGEAGLRVRVSEALEDGDRTLAQLERAASEGDLATAARLENAEWRVAGDSIDTEVRNLLLFNVQHANEHAHALQKLWRLLSDLSLGLGFLLLGVGAAATWVAAAAVSRQVRHEGARSAELEMFAGRAAHDVLGPISSALMALQVLARSSDPKTEATAGRALASLRRAAQVVEGLFNFAIAGGVPVPGRKTSVSAALSSLEDELAPEAAAARVALTWTAPSSCEVACGPEVLSIALSNLVRNSLKFMGNASERRVAVTASAQESIVRFEVSDTGPGLPAGFEDQAFRPYSRGRNDLPGLGLGLATVKGLVEAYGGRIGAGPQGQGASQGATFWFTLPRAPSSTGTSEMAA